MQLLHRTGVQVRRDDREPRSAFPAFYKWNWIFFLVWPSLYFFFYRWLRSQKILKIWTSKNMLLYQLAARKTNLEHNIWERHNFNDILIAFHFSSIYFYIGQILLSKICTPYKPSIMYLLTAWEGWKRSQIAIFSIKWRQGWVETEFTKVGMFTSSCDERGSC